MVSNTPLSRVLSSEPRDTLTFQIDLWSAAVCPATDGVSSRQKDIQYSSRTRAITDHDADAEHASGVAADDRKLPKSAKKIRNSAPSRTGAPLLLQHHSSIYQSKIYEGQSKDYEFGLSAMRAHWQSGLDDIRRTLADPRRLDPPAPELGIVTHDVHRRD